MGTANVRRQNATLSHRRYTTIDWFVNGIPYIISNLPTYPIVY